ncbi:MAG: DUF2326 domain-containing protein [Halanaerobiales bacterium]|nr:DUF2326 domain-containing protein [Halanaerobiales bacterium]
MIINRLIIYGHRDKEFIKKYRFNENGLNIVVGEKRDNNEETNGVGKTTLVECLRYILGSSIPDDISASKEIIVRDIFLCIEITINNKKMYLGRRVIDKNKGYVLDNGTFTMDMKKWKVRLQNDYKDFINMIICSNKSEKTPDFSSLKELIIRNEKYGFNDIIIPNRKAVSQYSYLSYLFRLPFESEKILNDLKKPIVELKNELKIIKSMADEIDSLKITKNKLEKEIKQLNSMLDKLDISENYKSETDNYANLKLKLNEVQKSIYKREHIVEQYKRNITDLNRKVEEIKAFKDVEIFYSQLLDYFPESIVKSYEEISEYYNFMIDNRGKYFQSKVEMITDELENLYSEKIHLYDEINEASKFLENDKLINDITHITNKINRKNKALATCSAKIDLYDKKNEINKRINTYTGKLIHRTNLLEDEFNVYNDYLIKIQNTFKSLLEKTYDEEGILEFEFDNRTGIKDTSGRIKIKCKIEDEKSHGRLYMKINIFDLTWFLTQLEYENSINILIHDGSYCKPDITVKARTLKYVDLMLKKVGKGQYFVTLNVDEVTEVDYTYFDSNSLIAVKLDRADGHKNRFFGFKYN